MKPFLVLFFYFISLPAYAGEFKSYELASSLGNILASEDLCGLSYNQDAIQAFIEKKVPADDLKFTSTLTMMVEGSKYNNKSFTKSQKTAHCAQIKRVAKHYGFVD